MTVRNSTLFSATVGLTALLLVLMAAHSRYRELSDLPSLLKTSGLVRDLALSDLCLFTEASYTRHLSQADLHTPFQEYPLSFEHFPSGALASPPANLTESHVPHH